MKVRVKLKGPGGNAFAIMHTVADAMRAAGETKEKIADYVSRAGAAKTYDELLAISAQTGKVEYDAS